MRKIIITGREREKDHKYSVNDFYDPHPSKHLQQLTGQEEQATSLSELSMEA